ncbi:hypothetical protein [Chryseobacterium lathyri]|uniref:PH domain-containing protein n=1 Tax=Chryseobacterium lathyri TaxID=395933 RepID=A0ABT9SQZ1_9FLAO|nr:hypothetical protein [Chryseobacterium lathyri]MDP9960895.1 hypothetical protein [Chryseobacterium lathyri]
MTSDYKTFNIYKPSENFVWTRSRIIWGLVIIPLICIFFVLHILKIPEKQIPDWLRQGIFAPMLTGFLGYLINIWLPEELKGKIKGKLIFEKEKITIDQEIFLIKDLKYVEIVQNDHKGRYIFSNAFDGMFSQGCNNTLKIRLLNNLGKKCFFQINHPRELLQISNQLNFYIENGLLTKEARNSTLNYNGNGF